MDEMPKEIFVNKDGWGDAKKSELIEGFDTKYILPPEPIEGLDKIDFEAGFIHGKDLEIALQAAQAYLKMSEGKR